MGLSDLDQEAARTADLAEDASSDQVRIGQVVKLDRGFPLVRCLDTGEQLRCEHATDLVKEGRFRVVVGDRVEVLISQCWSGAPSWCARTRRSERWPRSWQQTLTW